MDKLVYVAGNPVKDFLVDEVWQWPGMNGFRLLMQGGSMRARRPKHFFRDDGVMPAEVTLELVIPPELGERAVVLEELRTRVQELEEATRALRHATGRHVIGRKRVQAQSWHDSPTSPKPRRTLRPRFAGPTDARINALASYREFLATYDDARHEWRLGRACQFPEGTYWLARFAPITIRPSSN
jgi:hypothetical protein